MGLSERCRNVPTGTLACLLRVPGVEELPDPDPDPGPDLLLRLDIDCCLLKPPDPLPRPADPEFLTLVALGLGLDPVPVPLESLADLGGLVTLVPPRLLIALTRLGTGVALTAWAVALGILFAPTRVATTHIISSDGMVMVSADTGVALTKAAAGGPPVALLVSTVGGDVKLAVGGGVCGDIAVADTGVALTKATTGAPDATGVTPPIVGGEVRLVGGADGTKLVLPYAAGTGEVVPLLKALALTLALVLATDETAGDTFREESTLNALIVLGLGLGLGLL